ncbi:MAG TPA: TolC family protein, partial [Flavobacterium sp.]|nr:TolC family protein [Flavobacterium sp.]
MRKFLTLFSVFCVSVLSAQTERMSYAEYLGYVKKYHPLVRQANLEVSAAQAALMVARGGFDPKIEVDYTKKEFKGIDYYDLLNSTFKIPTWYGIEVKAGFEQADGIYVDPQVSTPTDGLAFVGVQVPLGQGLFINQRMADVRAAKAQLRLGVVQRRLLATQVLYDASKAYFQWKRTYEEFTLYGRYLEFAQVRYEGIRKLILAGDKPAIDSVEAGITVKNRRLSLEESRLKLTKARLELSNYLWIDDVPVELSETIMPEERLAESIVQTLELEKAILDPTSVENHPKIESLKVKLDVLEIERKLKANALLPRLDASYQYLSSPSYLGDYVGDDYKIGLNFSFPLFLRKERGSLRLAKLKIQDGNYELSNERLQLRNKIEAQKAEITIL